MVALVHAELGPVSILVNNAGIASRGLSVVDTDPAELRRVVSVDAFGSHYLSKLVVPEMRELPRGDIVMISSVASRGLAANSGPYNMAKAAKEALAVTLSREERQHGIRVNVVAPGLAETGDGAPVGEGHGRHHQHAHAGRADAVRQGLPAGRYRQRGALFGL